MPTKFTHRLKTWLVPALLAGALPVTGAGAAQQPASVPKAPAASINAFQEQAVKLGANRCVGLFSALGQSATAGSTYAVQVHANRDAPNAHSVAGVAGLAYDTPDYKGQAAAIALAAPVGKGCEGQLVRVAPFQRPCPEVLSLLPAGSTGAANLSGVPLYNLGENKGQALLLSSGQTCIVVTVAPGGSD